MLVEHGKLHYGHGKLGEPIEHYEDEDEEQCAKENPSVLHRVSLHLRSEEERHRDKRH